MFQSKSMPFQIIKANTPLFITCMFIQQLQRVDTILGAVRKKKENQTQNQLSKNLFSTKRDDTT